MRALSCPRAHTLPGGPARGLRCAGFQVISREADVLPPPHGASPKPTIPDPCHPIPRANPYPEVTDLFCRLPLPTLSCRLEASNLGDLMRIRVRLGGRIILSPRFSWADGCAPDVTNKRVTLCRVSHLISGRSDSKVALCAHQREASFSTPVKKKRELFPGQLPASRGSFVLPQHYISIPVW